MTRTSALFELIILVHQTFAWVKPKSFIKPEIGNCLQVFPHPNPSPGGRGTKSKSSPLSLPLPPGEGWGGGIIFIPPPTGGGSRFSPIDLLGLKVSYLRISLHLPITNPDEP